MSAQSKNAGGKPRLVALSANLEDFPLDAQVRQFCVEYGFGELGIYHDAALGEIPVRAFASGDGKVNARFFHLPGREQPVIELESAFANGECLVTTTAPVTGAAASWVDLLAVDEDFHEVALRHGSRLAVAEARAGVEAVAVRTLTDHFELCGRVEFGYDFSGLFPGATLGATPATDAMWYYSVAGERRGPVRLGEIKAMLRAGKLVGRRDMAWMPDFPDWLRIVEIPELAALVPAAAADADPLPAAPVKAVAVAGVAAPVAEAQWPEDEREESFGEMMANRDDPGIGRFAYLAAMVIFNPGLTALGSLLMVRYGQDIRLAILLIAALSLMASIAVAIARLRNLRMPWPWVFGLWVPGLNVWLAFRLFVCPPGYADHGRLGPAGVFLGLIFTGFLAVAVLVPMAFAFHWVPDDWLDRLGQSGISERLGPLQEQLRNALPAPSER